MLTTLAMLTVPASYCEPTLTRDHFRTLLEIESNEMGLKLAVLQGFHTLGTGTTEEIFHWGVLGLNFSCVCHILLHYISEQFWSEDEARERFTLLSVNCSCL